MRFVAICTIFVAVLTLAIHGISASLVGTFEKADQVNQGLSYLSKRGESTCEFVANTKHVSFEEKIRLHTILTKFVGWDAACQVINVLLNPSTWFELSKLHGKNFCIDEKSPSDSSPTGKSSDSDQDKELKAFDAVLAERVGPKLVKLISKLCIRILSRNFLLKL
jgi:hypothetical protein